MCKSANLKIYVSKCIEMHIHCRAKDWGEEGYFRIKSGVNKCGVAVDAVHSVV